MITAILYEIAICLGLTLVVEIAMALLLGVKRKDLLLVALVNIITNPIAVLVGLLARSKISYGDASTFFVILGMEVFAVVVEWLLYKFFLHEKIPIKPFALSLVLNISSFALALIIITMSTFK